jgi:hypothetical protein
MSYMIYNITDLLFDIIYWEISKILIYLFQCDLMLLYWTMWTESILIFYFMKYISSTKYERHLFHSFGSIIGVQTDSVILCSLCKGTITLKIFRCSVVCAGSLWLKSRYWNNELFECYFSVFDYINHHLYQFLMAQLNPWNRTLLKNIIIGYIFMRCPALFGTQTFVY